MVVARPSTSTAAGSTSLMGDMVTTVLAGYSQILLSRSKVVGLLLLASTAVMPRLFLFGLGGVVLALGLSRLMHLSSELSRSGLYGYNALLVAVGGAAILPLEWQSVLLLTVAVLASVAVTAALHSALWSTFNLPVLTLPFLFVFYLLLGAAPQMGLTLSISTPDALAQSFELPRIVSLYFQSLGAIFFSPKILSGVLVFLALLVFSRIAVSLSLMGFAVAYLFGVKLGMLSNGEMLPLIAGYNFILTAVAIGGVWFVPSSSSFVLAFASVLVCGLVTAGAEPLLARGGVPLLILPFNLTVILVLYAMRQRVRDARPKSVDFLIGTPEQNLNYFQTRVARFGAHSAVRLHAPFLGRWVCTQGVDGEHTHRGLWRHALDFEVQGIDGLTYRNRGTDVRDYLCFRMPVISPADGTVVQVIDDVPDNPIGEMNLRENWGNAVLIYHAPGLYSLVAHLAAGSVEVREGQRVKRGDALGRCGNSGRSEVPHIHFQLQSVGLIGAGTREVELHDAVDENGDEALVQATWVPNKGDVVRNLEPNDAVSKLLRFPFGESLAFQCEDGDSKGTTEHFAAEVDLYGAVELRSQETSALLFFDHGERTFTAYDTIGDHRSVLHLLQAAIGRVPFEVGPRWHDELTARRFFPRPLGWLLDVIAPFVGRFSITVTYEAEWQNQSLVVRGHSHKQKSDGSPWLKTEAIFDREMGLRELSLTINGRRQRITRVVNTVSTGAVIADEDPKSRKDVEQRRTA